MLGQFGSKFGKPLPFGSLNYGIDVRRAFLLGFGLSFSMRRLLMSRQIGLVMLFDKLLVPDFVGRIIFKGMHNVVCTANSKGKSSNYNRYKPNNIFSRIKHYSTSTLTCFQIKTFQSLPRFFLHTIVMFPSVFGRR